MNPSFEHGQQELQRLETDARVTLGQRIRANHHHRAHDRGVEGPAHSHGMAHDDVPL